MWNDREDVSDLNDRMPDFQALKIELCTWRHNRTLYPGWLLAPYQTREKIWNNTKHWLSTAIETNTVWSGQQLLVLWRELTWRLGICLQIVPDEALDSIRRIVDELSDWAHNGAEVDVRKFFPVTEGWPSEFVPTVQELQECWLACKLSLLQGYRIRPDIQAFEEIENQLYAAQELSEDQQCLVLHQSSLRALSELDTDRTERLLAKWPGQPEDDYWLVRKAAVLLEMGDLPAARRVADDALRRIRGRQQIRHTDYWKLSREGWCLRLLAHVEWLEEYSSGGDAVDTSANNPGTEEWTNPSWKAKFDHRLEAARCSPDAELRTLHGRINKRFPPVRPVERVANPPSFNTGDVNASIRWSTDIPSDRLAPAINLLLASDTTGYSLAGDVGMYSTSWIRDEFPGVWAAFALRFGGIGVTRDPDPSGETKPDSIRRRTLEQLPHEHIERLFSATLKDLVRTVDDVQADKYGGTLAIGSGVLKSAARLSDIVTRLSMCLNADAREKLLELLLQVARIPLFRQHPVEQDTIRHLAERSIPYLEKEQLERWFFKILVNIPLDNGQDVQGRGLPIIADNLRLSKIDKVERNKSEEVDAGIQQLIEGVDSSDIITRTDAALRLLLLVDLKVLSEEERDAFADSLWKQVDDWNLPVIDDMKVRKHVHVSWPEQVEGQSVSSLREWIISGSIEDRFGSSETNDEEVRNKRTVRWPDPDMYLLRILDLARRLEDNPETLEKVFDEKSRKHVLDSILDWWARERELFVLQANSSMTHLGDVFERVDLCFRVIFECALGKESLDEKTRDRVKVFLSEIEHLGKSSPYTCPILAFIDRDSQRATWNRIRSDLWSSDEEVAYKALIAAWRWQRGASKLNLKPMPENVFGVIISSIAQLDGVVGYHGLRVLRLLMEKENLPDEKMVLPEIVAAVESAASKLSYAGEHVGINVSDEERRVHVRRYLAELIVCLGNCGVRVGPAGTRWIRRAKDDCFVDVRHIARNWAG